LGARSKGVSEKKGRGQASLSPRAGGEGTREKGGDQDIHRTQNVFTFTHSRRP